MTLVEYTQVDCSNKICQAAFNKVLLEESRKREVARVDKEKKQKKNKADKLKANKAIAKKKLLLTKKKKK